MKFPRARRRFHAVFSRPVVFAAFESGRWPHWRVVERFRVDGVVMVRLQQVERKVQP